MGFGKNANKKRINNNNILNNVSPEFKDLFEKMICPKPKERINITQIKKHIWLKKMVDFYGEYPEIKEKKEKIEINKKLEKKSVSAKETKVKNLSHNPSFNKDEKKFLQNENNNLDNISNHSDDTNQKIKINAKKYSENFYLNLNNKENIKNTINTKDIVIKEFEQNFFKELALRKLSIDKILKEQEDEGD